MVLKSRNTQFIRFALNKKRRTQKKKKLLCVLKDLQLSQMTISMLMPINIIPVFPAPIVMVLTVHIEIIIKMKHV